MRLNILSSITISCFCYHSVVNAFITPRSITSYSHQSISQHEVPKTFLYSTNSDIITSTEIDNNDLSSNSNNNYTEERKENNLKLQIPLTFKEMILQTSNAISEAYESGLTRQTIRILLPRDVNSGNLGIYFEDDAAGDSSSSSRMMMNDDGQNVLLVPPDESWQGGIMQLYRATAPSCREILRRLSNDIAGVPPKILEDRSIDESGVDGVGLFMTQNRDPANDISMFVQPLQETVDLIEQISKNQAGKRLVVLLNPQWRNVDDALDSASKQSGFLGSFASFLGGKGGSLKRLEECGFENVFTIEGYVCKGGNVRLIKRFDSDWVVFAQNDSETGYVRIGESLTRPTYQEVDAMLDAKGVSLKYARDIGLAPKLE